MVLIAEELPLFPSKLLEIGTFGCINSSPNFIKAHSVGLRLSLGRKVQNGMLIILTFLKKCV